MLLPGGALLVNASVLASHPIVIHQTMPYQKLGLGNTWTDWYPTALHVRWSDADNRKLVATAYPEHLALYDDLALTVQRTDVARLLYLHRFGGLYVDDDYECKGDVMAELRAPGRPPVQIVRSRVLLNEVLQNSFMYSSRPAHPFFAECVETIAEIHAFVVRGCHLSFSCLLLALLNFPPTRDVMNVILTQYMTGPAVLDKTLVLRPSLAADVRILPCETYFVGTLAHHRHDNSWVTLLHPSTALLILVGVPCCLACVVARRNPPRAHRKHAHEDEDVAFLPR